MTIERDSIQQAIERLREDGSEEEGEGPYISSSDMADWMMMSGGWIDIPTPTPTMTGMPMLIPGPELSLNRFINPNPARSCSRIRSAKNLS
jgi:hypothetical protein